MHGCVSSTAAVYCAGCPYLHPGCQTLGCRLVNGSQYLPFISLAHINYSYKVVP